MSEMPMVRGNRHGAEVPLAMDPEQFRRMGHELVDRLAEHLGGLPGKLVTHGSSPEVVREALGAEAPLPNTGTDCEVVMREATDLLLTHSLFNGHPRFFGYITASPAPIGMLADLLAAGVNPNVGGWTLSPMATEMEAQTVRWIADLIGYPSGGDGLLVSGGNMANFVGFLAARTSVGSGWRIRETGLAGPGSWPLRVYASQETHTWIQKAADLFGLGTEATRLIPTDSAFRMDPEALRQAVEEDRSSGIRPFLLVGTAGSTSTGAVDPLTELAGIAREEGLWFHVDGAYGGFAAGVPGAPPELEGLALADSVAVDPHKWLYSPLEAGCILIRKAGLLGEAFAYHPPYYHFGVETINYAELGPQNSRGFRALKVWTSLKQAGREGYHRLISQDMALARHLHGLTGAHPELEPLAQGLSISVFRFVPEDLRGRMEEAEVEDYLSRLNKGIQARLESEGKAFVSNAVIRGAYALRACIVNINTEVADVEALPETVVEVGRVLHAQGGA